MWFAIEQEYASSSPLAHGASRRQTLESSMRPECFRSAWKRSFSTESGHCGLSALDTWPTGFGQQQALAKLTQSSHSGQQYASVLNAASRDFFSSHAFQAPVRRHNSLSTIHQMKTIPSVTTFLLTVIAILMQALIWHSWNTGSLTFFASTYTAFGKEVPATLAYGMRNGSLWWGFPVCSAVLLAVVCFIGNRSRWLLAPLLLAVGIVLGMLYVMYGGALLKMGTLSLMSTVPERLLL
jgi:hypothetical protein